MQYFGGTEDRPACDYDYKPLTEIVAEHLGYFDLTVEDTPADLYVLVLTQPEDAVQKQQYIQELTAVLNERLKADLPVILIDASNGQYGTAFHDALTKKAELGKLLSYAGFLDMAIVTGPESRCSPLCPSHSGPDLAGGGGCLLQDPCRQHFEGFLL